MSNLPTERVAAEVRAAMARHRITQEHMARLLGLSQTALSRRLTGAVAFDVNELARVAEHLGMASADLLGQPERAAS